jgi:hypothetical protein
MYPNLRCQNSKVCTLYVASFEKTPVIRCSTAENCTALSLNYTNILNDGVTYCENSKNCVSKGIGVVYCEESNSCRSLRAGVVVDAGNARSIVSEFSPQNIRKCGSSQNCSNLDKGVFNGPVVRLDGISFGTTQFGYYAFTPSNSSQKLVHIKLADFDYVSSSYPSIEWIGLGVVMREAGSLYGFYLKKTSSGSVEYLQWILDSEGYRKSESFLTLQEFIDEETLLQVDIDGDGLIGTIPTKSPTTAAPTQSPTRTPTTASPTKSPTQAPTKTPTTASPTNSPTTASPTLLPTTSAPTSAPKTSPISENPSISEIVKESFKQVDFVRTANSSSIENVLASSRIRKDQFTGDYIASISSSLALVKLKARSDEGKFMSFAVRKLIDSKGNEAAGLETLSWSFSGPETAFNPQNNIKYQKYFASIQPSVFSLQKSYLGVARLEMQLEFYMNNGSIRYGDSLVPLYPGSVKFSFKISNWPFQSTNDRLYLGMSAVSSGTVDLSLKGSRINIGDGFILTPFFALKDNSQEKVPIQISNDKVSESQGMLLFDFPAFSNYIYYDPVASMNSNSFAKIEEAASNWVSTFLAVFIQILILAAISAAVWYIRRRRTPLPKQSTTAGASNNKKSSILISTVDTSKKIPRKGDAIYI